MTRLIRTACRLIEPAPGRGGAETGERGIPAFRVFFGSPGPSTHQRPSGGQVEKNEMARRPRTGWDLPHNKRSLRGASIRDIKRRRVRRKASESLRRMVQGVMA